MALFLTCYNFCYTATASASWYPARFSILASRGPVMDGDWRSLLIGEAARTSIAATARRLGYSRTAVSLVLAGKYPGSTDKLAARVLAEPDPRNLQS